MGFEARSWQGMMRASTAGTYPKNNAARWDGSEATGHEILGSCTKMSPMARQQQPGGFRTEASSVPQARNLTVATGTVASRERSAILGQRGVVIWLTGLSGSGKSTLAFALERKLTSMGRLCYALDGDNVRMGLCSDLGFSPSDRAENIRRIGEVAALFADAGVLTLASFISPYEEDRRAARKAAPQGKFIEVYLDVPVEVCERRDPKGLYKKAREGQITNFTGVSAPYEVPIEPEVVLNTDALSVEECVGRVVDELQRRGHLTAGDRASDK